MYYCGLADVCDHYYVSISPLEIVLFFFLRLGRLLSMLLFVHFFFWHLLFVQQSAVFLHLPREVEVRREK
jgi:hypothetical protein